MSARSACAQAMRQQVCISRPSGENPRPGGTAVSMRPFLSNNSCKSPRPSGGQTLSGPQGCQTRARHLCEARLPETPSPFQGNAPLPAAARRRLRAPRRKPPHCTKLPCQDACYRRPSTQFFEKACVTAMPQQHGSHPCLNHETRITWIGKRNEAHPLLALHP